ncbi:hypothetical protein [Chryseobacterium lathyri]|uniref:hypothetical protein n=1 Tax=Chryseobacterium lathyri TaxID=395933 RepID=UPI001CC17412|nr:hypothetical protein [Chryseobacterium lathyri]
MGGAEYSLSEGNSNGFIEYMDHGNLTEAWGYTSPKSLTTGLSKVSISPIAAQNSKALFLTMAHETGHAYASFLGLGRSLIDLKANNIGWEELADTEHFAIYKLENFTALKNNIPIIGKLSTVRLDSFFRRLSTTERSSISSIYEKLLPIFDRVMK